MTATASRGTAARPRRILFATVDSNWAGAQIQMLELAQGLDRTRFEPVVLTTGNGALVERSRAAGIPTHVMPYTFLRRHVPFIAYYALGPVILRRLLRRERIALVHTHCPNSGVPLMNAARGLDLPLAAHIHDFDQRWVTPRTLRIQNRPQSTVIAISDAVARYALGRGVDPARVRRIYNGIHLPAFALDARVRARRALGIGDGELAVGLVGRIVERKGAADLVRALADPRLSGVRIRSFLIGPAEGAERGFGDDLRRLISELGLEDRVVFAGSRDDAPALHAGFDIAAVPARREAFGRAVVEAMHAGVPVVAYREAALPELVRDEVEGLLIESGDIGALAAAIARLADDGALRARLGARGRVRAQAFEHARFVGEVTSLYHEMLADDAGTVG